MSIYIVNRYSIYRTGLSSGSLESSSSGSPGSLVIGAHPLLSQCAAIFPPSASSDCSTRPKFFLHFILETFLSLLNISYNIWTFYLLPPATELGILWKNIPVKFTVLHFISHIICQPWNICPRHQMSFLKDIQPPLTPRPHPPAVDELDTHR